MSAVAAKRPGFRVDVRAPIRLASVSNLREHWAAKAARAKGQRASARLSLMSAAMGWGVRGALWASAKSGGLTVTLTRIAPRRLDDDNLRGACKAVRDGVADWLGLDDGDPRITWEYGQAKGAPGEYAVRIEVATKVAA